MIDFTADTPETSAPAQAVAGTETEHRMMGYCAGCGTWDAHGLSCTSCGYNFAADGDGAAPPLD